MGRPAQGVQVFRLDRLGDRLDPPGRLGDEEVDQLREDLVAELPPESAQGHSVEDFRHLVDKRCARPQLDAIETTE